MTRVGSKSVIDASTKVEDGREARWDEMGATSCILARAQVRGHHITVDEVNEGRRTVDGQDIVDVRCYEVEAGKGLYYSLVVWTFVLLENWEKPLDTLFRSK